MFDIKGFYMYIKYCIYGRGYVTILLTQHAYLMMLLYYFIVKILEKL